MLLTLEHFADLQVIPPEGQQNALAAPRRTCNTTLAQEPLPRKPRIFDAGEAAAATRAFTSPHPGPLIFAPKTYRIFQPLSVLTAPCVKAAGAAEGLSMSKRTITRTTKTTIKKWSAGLVFGIAAAGLSVAPVPVRASDAGAVAAAAIGGLALGALAGGAAAGAYAAPPPPDYYGPAPVYYAPPPPRCWWEPQEVWNGWAFIVRRVRVCY
jgi:hypothetical protein